MMMMTFLARNSKKTIIYWIFNQFKWLVACWMQNFERNQKIQTFFKNDNFLDFY